jgi:hypothetical protein
MEHAVTVVQDLDGVLAVLVEPGAQFTFHEHPFGVHPWSGQSAWQDTTVLQLHRDGDAYGVWKFFAGDGRFLHWYINFEEPIVRHVDADGGGSYDTDDHGIDIVVRPDGSWAWKDVEHVGEMVTSGRIHATKAAEIRSAAAAVADVLDRGSRWWAAWDDWTPARRAAP